MFHLFLSLMRRWKARRIADKIATVIIAASGLRFFLKDDQEIPNDDFVRAYLYGTISCSMRGLGLSGRLETKGWVIWETFERLFPGKAANLVAWCNQKVEAEDKEFKGIAAIGFEEMKRVLEALNSRAANVKTLESLHAHLARRP